LLLAGSLAACDDAPAAVAAASAVPSDTTPTAKEACSKVCERAARCGLEQVEKLAANGSPQDAEIVAKAKARSVAVEASCADACTPSAEASAGAPDRLASCLDQARCDTFAACIERVGSDPG
jgi:hypothetical protein